MRTAKFGSKQKARRIGQEDSDDETKPDAAAVNATGDVSMPDASESMLDIRSIDTRTLTNSLGIPVFKKKSTAFNKRKPTSKLRVNYDSSDIAASSNANDDEEGSGSVPLVIKKSNLARQAIERNASSSSLSSVPTTSAKIRKTTLIPPATAAQSLEQLSLSSARPSYSAEALKELRTSTPSTPKDAVLDYDPLDIASKFAEDRAISASAAGTSGIPDPSVVSALKARRALLAANPDYISLTTPSKHESRLQTVGGDDEAFLQSYVEDDSRGGLVDEAELARRKLQSIHDAIDDSGSEESTDEEMREWESAQIRSGGIGSMKVESLEQKLKKAPTVMAPLPSLANALGRLEGILAEMNAERDRKTRVLEELAEQRTQIDKREKEVQELLRVKGEAYERLRRDIGGAKEVGRGLESFGDDHSVTMVDA